SLQLRPSLFAAAIAPAFGATATSPPICGTSAHSPKSKPMELFKLNGRNGAPALSITTDENLLNSIESENTDNRLRLHSYKNLWPTHGIKVVVSSPTRFGARLTGATRLTANQLSGAKFAVESTGAAHVTLDGNIDQLLADMTGASELNAQSLQTKTAEISTTGAADANIAVSETLKVS